jgi:tetratricopeptide (TPR) repeat protein
MPCWCNGQCPHRAAPLELLKQGKAGRALVAMRGALTAAPFCPEVNLMLASYLARNNRAADAEIHVERAFRYGDPARVTFEAANVYRNQCQLEKALPAFLRALELAPENPNVSAAFILAVEVTGDLKEAKRLADSARARFPDNAEIRRAAGVVAAAAGDHAGAIEIFSSPGAEMQPVEYLDRGRSLESLGRHDEAWADWKIGKALARDKLGHRYNAELFAKQAAGLAEIATPPRPDYIAAAPPLAEGPAPIFVCGFPRSGTTLTETILSAHSAVLAGDELMALYDVMEALPLWCKVRVPYPSAMLATTLGENVDAPEMLRDLYMKSARRRVRWKKAPGKKLPRYFTDKMPLNELHLPLIRMLFPDALVLRLERHPLDVMVSCMSQWLAHGGFFGSSLEDCARHYAAVDGLIESYKKNFAATGAKLFVPIGYENLVEKPEENIRFMLAAAGLPFEKQCLAPHKNPRHARTLSYAQVRKPINSAGVGRWKNFRAQLAPAVEILKPILERGGYEF